MDPASEWWTVEGWKPAGLQRGATTPALGVRGSKTPRTSPNGIQPAPYVVGRRGADAPRPRRPAAAVAVRGLATPGLLLTLGQHHHHYSIFAGSGAPCGTGAARPA